MKEVLPN
ncbi:uncharacterized protein FTOL_13932 [Fusarium torulosum]|nr:uncharacterized protein FTOL_13932 [Fusarium torulosum]